MTESELIQNMEKLFVKGKVPKIETELDIWKVIESLGGFIWRMDHDDADGRITLSEKDKEFMTIGRKVSEELVEILKQKYNVIPPKECPIVDFGETRPPAPKGKLYYWDWYNTMKKNYFREEYNNIICSACSLHENNGAERMQIHVPCDVFNGVIYRLIYPYECAMLHTGSDKWSQEKLYEEIKKKGGEDSVKSFKQKYTELKIRYDNGELE